MMKFQQNLKAWPFQEAYALINSLGEQLYKKDIILFETGYGPSGLPHIGTFGEIARTSMVRHAFEYLTEGKIKTKLIAFSDDMDGLRKIPDNIPNPEKLKTSIGKPLTQVPDPFEKYDSFAKHNNQALIGFLDQFGFDYEFYSSTQCYHSGLFDRTLLLMLEKYDQIMEIMLPTLRSERQKTYSPFLPISPLTGRVLEVPTLERNTKTGTIIFEDEDGKKKEVPVTGGNVKVQWKPDWAMRWYMLGIDYEMAGKDISESVKISGKICRCLGGKPPSGFQYELFLDQQGEKISKSKGNGLSIEDWLNYGVTESLSYYMFQKPRTAKKLYFDVIPKACDEYLSHIKSYLDQDEQKKLENPIWHIHQGIGNENLNAQFSPVSFSLLLNLATAANTEDTDMLWGFIHQYTEQELTPETHTLLKRMIERAVNYYQDFIKPEKIYRTANPYEAQALKQLKEQLECLLQEQKSENSLKKVNPEQIQNLVYQIGKNAEINPLKNWFKALYEILLGQSQGPRFGSFIALYGIKNTIKLIDKALNEELIRQNQA